MVAVVLAGTFAAVHADTLTPEDLARKNENGYVTGLSLFAYSTDIGVGGGARAYYYWDGHRDDPRFAETPYLFRMFVQAFASTRGLQFHWIDLDAPKIAGSPYRFRAQLIYERNINQNYFGLGKRSLAPLAFPGATGTFSKYGDYTDAQLMVDQNGNSWSKYDQFDLERPFVVTPATFQSKSVNTPFDGWTLRGGPVMTIVGGRVVHDAR